MTLSEAHNAFYIEMDKRPISAAPSFLHDEIDYFINKAYVVLINRKFTGNNILKQGFEASPKRTSDLYPLVKRDTLSIAAVGNHSMNEFGFSLSSNVPSGNEVLIPIASVFRASSSNYFPTVEINHAVVDKFRYSNVNNPWIPVPGVLYEDSMALVYVDTTTLSGISGTGFPMLDLTYIKKPLVMNYTTNPNATFEVDWTDEIISLAVDFALDNVESQRIQTHPNVSTNAAE